MIRTLKNYVKTNNQELDEIKLYFEKCAADIDRSNLYMLRRSCMYTSIVFVCMLFFAVNMIPKFNVTSGHYLMLSMLLVYFFVNIYTRAHDNIKPFVTSVLCLLFYFLVGMSFILMEIYSRITDHTRWLPLLLMIFPVLFIDRIFKYLLEETFMVIVYAIISYQVKDPIHFSRDIYTVAAAYILSLLTARIVLGLRSKQGLAMAELRRYSSMDKLTNVYNKAALLEEIDSYLANRTPDTTCAMCIIDVDNFKHVNDSLGHGGGDLLLEHIGKLLLASFRPTDIVGRFGGDEFIVFMPGMKDAQLMEFRCRTAQTMLADFRIGNDEPFSLSIGCIIDEGNHSREELFEMADDALYKSKMAGKNRTTSWMVHEDVEGHLPILVFSTSLDDDRAGNLPEREKGRFNILFGQSDDEALRYISQYADRVKIVVAELNSTTKSGELVVRYVKGRVRFSNIPVLAVVNSAEGAALAKELGADSVLHTDDPDEIFKKTIAELAGHPHTHQQ